MSEERKDYVSITDSKMHGFERGFRITATRFKGRHEFYLKAESGYVYPAVFFRDTDELAKIHALARETCGLLNLVLERKMDADAVRAAAEEYGRGAAWLYVMREKAREVVRFVEAHS